MKISKNKHIFVVYFVNLKVTLVFTGQGEYYFMWGGEVV